VPEVEFIEYNGLRILRIHFPDGIANEAIMSIIARAKEAIASQPLSSALTLTIFGDFHFDSDTAKAFREYVQHNKAYVRAGAVVGITGIRKALYNSYMILSQRKIKICENETEALAFLASGEQLAAE